MTGRGEVRRRLVVSGRVQGVGYRMACSRRAHELGVRGSVRNLADGRVEVVAEGPRAAIDELVRWAKAGPPMARVTDLAVVDEVPRGEHSFVAL